MFPNRINKLISQATELAKINPAKFKLACIAINKRGKVLSIGLNSSQSHPYQAKLALRNGHKDQIGLHSEIAAIVKCRKPIYCLIIVRVLHNGELAMAKPCKICSAAIRLAEIKTIIYSTNTGFILENIK